jgi:hypothetical protein
MIRTLAIIAAFTLAAGSASAQKLDAKGRCVDAHGKPAPASACKSPAPAAASAATVQKASTAAAPHHCITGKPCGQMCIPDYWTCKAK